MKFSFPVILTVILLCSCHHIDKKSKNPNELTYNADDVKSGPLSATLNLSADMSRMELTSELKLSNTGSDPIEIQDIVISTDAGLRSLPENGSISFSLKPGSDSTMSIKFQPINDLKFYQVTGLQGDLKPAYSILISYKIAGNDNILNLAVKSQADKKSYLDYTRKFTKPVTGYSFNTKTSFNESEKKYLEALKLTNQPGFVYISDQEIAVSGLNFRLNSYYLQDTLRAELSVVNHAGFPVKFIPDAFDITAVENQNPTENKIISFEKTSGSQQDKDTMEKGDRLSIHFRKYMQIKTPENETLVVHLLRAFVLSGPKNLFNEDVQLLPAALKQHD